MTHQCSICLKRFDFVSKLRRHQLTHSGLRPFSCSLCLKSFRQAAHLKGHLRRHAASSEVSLVLSRVPHSQVSDGGDLGEETGNECELRNDELDQQTDGTDPMTGDGQMGDVGHGDYDGVKDSNREKSSRNSQNSSCTKMSESSVQHPGDKHNPDPVIDEKTEMSSRRQCPVCLKCFSVPSKLQRHVLIHSSVRPFRCRVCPKAFRQLTHLRGHLTTHHPQSRPPEPLETPEGSDVGPDTGDLRSVRSLTPAEDRTHLRVGHECPVCQKCFSAPSKLRRHVLIHTGQRPFQCSLCCRAFRQLSHLKAHYSVHAGDGRRPVLQTPPTTGLKCPVHVSLARKFKAAKRKLKMSAALSSLLPAPGNRIHEHIPETSPVQKINHRSDHSCPVCLKNFSAPSKLRRHVLIHTGQRPFSCSICCRGFRQKSHLKIHKCSGGGRGMRPSTTEVHQRKPDSSRSPESIRAEDGFGFSLSIASESTPGDSYLAPLPHQPTPRPPDAANQSKQFGIQCTVCFKVFDFPSKLSRHLLIHMDVKPFKCDICSRSFRQLCHLQNHTKVHSVKHNKNLRGTSILQTFSETSNFTTEAGEPPVAQTPDLYTDAQQTELDDNSSFSHSIDMEFTPHVESTSLQGEDSSSEMKSLANQCIFCLKTFSFPSKLSRHLLVHTGIRPYRCHVCSKSFKQLSHLQNHLWIHSKNDHDELKAGVNPQGRMDCGGHTRSEKADLRSESSESSNQDRDGSTVHQKICCPDSDHCKCKVESETDLLPLESVPPTLNHDSVPSGSDRSTTSRKQPAENTECKRLDRTGEVHTPATDGTTRSPVWNGVEPVDSGDPGRDFIQTIEMTHLNGLPIYVSDSFQRSPIICDSFRLESNSHLKDPNLSEPQNPLAVCPSCTQCFHSLQELHTHVCPADGSEQRLLRSYQCAVCFKGFEAPSKLKRHYVIHTGQRPYRCDMCDKDYTQSSHLKKHMLSHS